MSGGVDSSVAALLLRDQGLGVAGMFMKNWEEDDRLGACSAEQDADDAAAVAERLGLEFHTRNFSAEYWDYVFENFLSEYAAGRTPNPDILCNREIKFKTFLEHAEDLGADRIATGHYARIDRKNGNWRLLRGKDGNKDQSYFLYTLGQQQLGRTLFPLGELEKPRVRELALKAKLAIHAKKDSTGICFIGERNFREFLAEYLPAKPGEMHSPEGDFIGNHDGLMYYTLGQRQGLGIGGRQDSGNDPWYVLAKDVDNNILYVGQGHDHPMLNSSRLKASQLSWVAGTAPLAGSRLVAKNRYRQPDQACTVLEIDSDTMYLEFENAQRAVTPGQSVVLYDREECLGGGIIDWCNAPGPGKEAHDDA
jgi:tRNA-specific 2-thiouridylase